MRLETERPIGGMGGIGAIPILSMYEFLERTRVPAFEWETFVYLWREMDGVTLKHYAEKMKSHQKKAGESLKGGKSRGGRGSFPE